MVSVSESDKPSLSLIGKLIRSPVLIPFLQHEDKGLASLS